MEQLKADLESSRYRLPAQDHKVNINNNNLHLPLAVFMAQVLVGLSIKCHKEI